MSSPTTVRLGVDDRRRLLAEHAHSYLDVAVIMRRVGARGQTQGSQALNTAGPAGATRRPSPVAAWPGPETRRRCRGRGRRARSVPRPGHQRADSVAARCEGHRSELGAIDAGQLQAAARTRVDRKRHHARSGAAIGIQRSAELLALRVRAEQGSTPEQHAAPAGAGAHPAARQRLEALGVLAPARWPQRRSRARSGAQEKRLRAGAQREQVALVEPVERYCRRDPRMPARER